MKRFLALLIFGAAQLFTTIGAKAQVCVWVDSENPGAVVGTQAGGSVSPITAKEVTAIRTLTTELLKTNKSNVVLNPCPQTGEKGENIELDVVVGKFRDGYVASVSTVIQGGKDGPLHVSSNVIAASTLRTLAGDVAIAYESLKMQASKVLHSQKSK